MSAFSNWLTLAGGCWCQVTGEEDKRCTLYDDNKEDLEQKQTEIQLAVSCDLGSEILSLFQSDLQSSDSESDLL